MDEQTTQQITPSMQNSETPDLTENQPSNSPVQAQQTVASPTQTEQVATPQPANPQPIQQPFSPVAPPSQPILQQTNKSKKPLLIALIGIVLLVVVAGSLAAFYMYMNNKPEKVLADAFTNTVADATEDKPLTALGTVQFESKSEDQTVKVKLTFDTKSANENSQTAAELTVVYGGKTYSVKTSAITFSDEQAYIKIDNLEKTLTTLMSSVPDFSAFSKSFGPLIKKIDGQWIKITKEDVAKFGGTDEKTVDACSAAIENLQFSKADKKQLKKLFKQNPFIVASEKLQNEDIADENSFHYKLDFNDQAAKDFATQVINLPSLAGVKKDCELDEKDIADNFSEISKEAEKNEDVTKPVFELWVGKKTRRPTQARVTANNKVMTLDFTTQMKLNATNVSIEKPEKSISINELKTDIEAVMQSALQP